MGVTLIDRYTVAGNDIGLGVAYDNVATNNEATVLLSIVIFLQTFLTNV